MIQNNSSIGTNMSQHKVNSLLVHFHLLFRICKFMGVYPYNWESFHRKYVLNKSTVGGWLVFGCMLLVLLLYNLVILYFREEDISLKATQSTLTGVISLFLTYIGLGMMMTDQLTAIRNQSKVGSIYERIQAVDEGLLKENITIDNSSISKRIKFMILITVVSEVTIIASTYTLLVESTNWVTAIWLFSFLPTFINSLDKIWFAITMFALKQRFESINLALEQLVATHEQYKSSIASKNDVNEEDVETIPIWNTSQYKNNLSSLYKDLVGLDVGTFKHFGNNKISPSTEVHPNIRNVRPLASIAYDSELNNVSKVEQKLNHFCQLHDEICEIGKKLNELWSYPILVLMAYGFLIFTAQLYFLYCATQDQPIPAMFRSAKNIAISTITLGYTAGKCVHLMYLSWKTSVESKRTGVCLHKCGVAADNNLLYEIVNHLSLKLLNHSVDFSACGFFTLDMETLYSVSGGITSYLIILIQFNLAGQQAKDAVRTSSNLNETYANGRNNSVEIYSPFNTMQTTISDY